MFSIVRDNCFKVSRDLKPTETNLTFHQGKPSFSHTGYRLHNRQIKFELFPETISGNALLNNDCIAIFVKQYILH